MHISEQFTQRLAELGDIGVFIGMFLESSIVPIPSEAIIVGAGSIGISIRSIVIFGSIGATAGACVGYLLGRYAAMPFIIKFGKFILIKPHHIQKAERFAIKYGVMSVLIGRVIPIVPFKVFSIAAGITKLPVVPFIFCTLVGVVPRIFLLAFFGMSLAKYTKPALIVAGIAILLFAGYKVAHYFYSNGKKKPVRTEEKVL